MNMLAERKKTKKTNIHPCTARLNLIRELVWGLSVFIFHFHVISTECYQWAQTRIPLRTDLQPMSGMCNGWAGQEIKTGQILLEGHQTSLSPTKDLSAAVCSSSRGKKASSLFNPDTAVDSSSHLARLLLLGCQSLHKTRPLSDTRL